MAKIKSALNSTVRADGPMASPSEAPKRRRGRPPKIEQEREKLSERRRGVCRRLPQESIEEIKAVSAASRIKKTQDCPVCAFPQEKREKVEEELLAVMAGVITSDGMSQVNQVANKYDLKVVDLIRHRDNCMLREAVLVLDGPKKEGAVKSTDIENSAAWIKQLTKYLDVADGVISNELGKDIPDPRVLLSAAESGRKICETNAKLFIELYKLRLDKRVMDDFIRSVLDVLERVAPAAKDEVIRQLKARLAVTTAAGLGGV